jgi:hypothetical protein
VPRWLAWPRLALAALALGGMITACTGGAATGQHAGRLVVRRGSAACAVGPGTVSLQVTAASARMDGARVLFGAVAVPPAYLPHVVKVGGRWPYWHKWGLSIRGGSPPLLITVPPAWRQRAAFTWGNDVGTVTGTLRLPSCPAPRGKWNGFAGGFYLRSRAACVPLVFRLGRLTRIARFGVGRRCGA